MTEKSRTVRNDGSEQNCSKQWRIGRKVVEHSSRNGQKRAEMVDLFRTELHIKHPLWSRSSLSSGVFLGTVPSRSPDARHHLCATSEHLMNSSAGNKPRAKGDGHILHILHRRACWMSSLRIDVHTNEQMSDILSQSLLARSTPDHLPFFATKHAHLPCISPTNGEDSAQSSDAHGHPPTP